MWRRTAGVDPFQAGRKRARMEGGLRVEELSSRRELRNNGKNRMANTFEEILGTAAGIAKGMGVTFKEMMSPTVTENYPDETPSLRSATAACTFCSATSTAWRSAWRASCARQPVPRTASTLKRPKTRIKCASAAASVTPRFTTSITTAASSADTAWRPVPPMPSRTGMDLKSASFNTSTLVMRKEQMLAPIPPGAHPPAVPSEPAAH